MGNEIASKPGHGEEVVKEGQASSQLQSFLDDIEQRLNDFLLGDAVLFPKYAKADLPNAADWEGGKVYVIDEIGGPVHAFSDGVDWRREQDRAVVS